MHLKLIHFQPNCASALLQYLTEWAHCQRQVAFLFFIFSDIFDNTVTFRKADATIEFPTFDAATSGDIRFQFRTTAENGIFLQNTGQSHFIEVKLVCKYQVP